MEGEIIVFISFLCSIRDHVLNLWSLIYTFNMKHLKKFNESISPSHREVEKFLSKGSGYPRFTINSDGSVDVEGHYNFDYNNLTKLPIKFGVVNGTLRLGRNHLTTLEGCPHLVTEEFSIVRNPIKSLAFSPKIVQGSFFAAETLITDLQGGPEFVGELSIEDNDHLTSLVGLPKEIEKHINISRSRRIWDFGPIRDCNLGDGLIVDRSDPVQSFMKLFGIGRFIESLDYNYFRGSKELELFVPKNPFYPQNEPARSFVKQSPTINLFRFQEALREFDINWTFDEYNSKFSNWYYLDGNGNVVDFEGEVIGREI